MRKNIFHIVLSFLLTIAVTDYVWYELLNDDRVAFELETEKEGEEKEELRENRSSESRNDLHYSFVLGAISSFSFERVALGFIKNGESDTPNFGRKAPRLFILFCSLLLDY